MPHLNKIQIMGHLGRDPEIRHTAHGDAVANFSVAVTDKYKDKEHTEWFNCTAWKQKAEYLKNYAAKGLAIYVEGRLQTREWQDKEGQTRKAVEVIADTVQLLSRKDKAEAASAIAGGFDDFYDDIKF